MQTIDQQVENLLQKKQENKKFKDAGERVGGSRKEQAAYKTVTLQNLSEIEGNGDAYKIVDKNRVFPQFDWKQQRDNGVSAGAAWMKWKIRSALSSKPIDLPEARQYYVEFLDTFRTELNDKKTLGEVTTVFSEMVDFVNKYIEIETPNTLGRNGRSLTSVSLINDVFGKSFWNIISRRKSLYVNLERAILKNAYTAEQQKEDGYDKESNANYERSALNDVKKQRAKIETITSEADLEAKGIEVLFADDFDSVHRYFVVPTSIKMTGSVFSKDILAKNIEALDDKIKKWQTKIDNWQPYYDKYKIRSADWSWAKIKGDKPKEKTETKTGKPTEIPIHYRSLLMEIVRIGGRKVENVTVKNIREKFCYKSVTFGNYVKDSEAAYHVEHYIASMLDLEEALGLDICKLNKLGNLSIAFGAYGRGKYLATYISALKIINITKKRGDGSVAHEWGHYLDNILADIVGDNELVTVNGSRGRFATESGAFDSRVNLAIKAIMDYIIKGSSSVVYVTYKNTGKYGDYAYKRENMATVESMVKHRRIGYRRYSLLSYANQSNNKGWFESIAKSAQLKEITIPYETDSTMFYSASSAMKSKYWSSKVELFARAWECYVEDKLKAKGIKNNYLVNIPESMIEQGLYPSGSERERLFVLFDNLIDAIKGQWNGVAKVVPTGGNRVEIVEDLSVSTLEKEKATLKESNFITSQQMSTDEKENQYRQNASDREKSRMKFIIPKYLNEFGVIPYFSAEDLLLPNAKKAVDKWTMEWEEMGKEEPKVEKVVTEPQKDKPKPIPSEHIDHTFLKTFLQWIQSDERGQRMIAKVRTIENSKGQPPFTKSDVEKDYLILFRRYVRKFKNRITEKSETQILEAFEFFYVMVVLFLREDIDKYNDFFEIITGDEGFAFHKKYQIGDEDKFVLINLTFKDRRLLLLHNSDLIKEVSLESAKYLESFVAKAKSIYYGEVLKEKRMMLEYWLNNQNVKKKPKPTQKESKTPDFVYYKNGKTYKKGYSTYFGSGYIQVTEILRKHPKGAFKNTTQILSDLKNGKAMVRINPKPKEAIVDTLKYEDWLNK